MLEIARLHARFGRRFSLHEISLQVAPGELVALLGPNGSGKTSLLRLVAGLLPPHAGTIRWCTTVLSSPDRVDVAPEDRCTAMLFQEGVLFPHLDVRDNVALGVPDAARDRDQRTTDALRMMHLEHLAREPVGSLSGGEQQRVALARALAQQPRVLLLDEPFHSLDAAVKRPIMRELRELVRSRSMAALLVTHDVDEAAALSDRIVLTRDGRVVQQGSMQELYTAPADDWVASFMGEVETADAGRAGLLLPPGAGTGVVRFRPEELALEPCEADQEAAAEVVALRHAGAYLEVAVKLRDGTVVRARMSADAVLHHGQHVLARVRRVLVLHSAPAGKA